MKKAIFWVLVAAIVISVALFAAQGVFAGAACYDMGGRINAHGGYQPAYHCFGVPDI